MSERSINPVQIVQLAAIGAGVYFVYELLSALRKPAEQGKSIYDQASELFDTMPDPSAASFASWYDPTQRIVFFYYLTFPDGSQHTVWASSVQSDGTFIGSDGALYRIGNDKSGGLRAYAYSPLGGATPGGW